MNAKDISLTVGGVIATMVLAYLLYKLQQRDAAAAAQANADNAAAAAAAQDSSLASYSNLYQFIPQVTTPTLTGATTQIPAAVASSGSVADTGSTRSGIDTSDANNLIAQIINDFAGSITQGATTPESVASMMIPTIAGSSSGSDLSGIPLTAQQAADLVATPSVVNHSNWASAYPISMESSAAVSSHPVDAHPIVTTGS